MRGCHENTARRELQTWVAAGKAETKKFKIKMKSKPSIVTHYKRLE